MSFLLRTEQSLSSELSYMSNDDSTMRRSHVANNGIH